MSIENNLLYMDHAIKTVLNALRFKANKFGVWNMVLET